ncbi:phage late control D family protein [Kutzneria sp. NPDC052558]|uniref:phage late control D family protein n=1 Tax=Kutzneria sp. NPDC052558 TaxID=3364121 RepID=UPI0037CAB360
MTDPAIAFDGPVFTVDGAVAGELARDCIRLEVEEGLEGLRTLHAHFLAAGPGATGPEERMLYLDGKTLDFGKTVAVTVGPGTDQRYAFEGVISAIEAVYADTEPPVVVVHAEDALMKLRMTRRSRTYQNVSDADLAERIAAEHGLHTDIAVDGPTYDVVQQANQSDLAFLRERARLVRAEIWCTGQTLHMQSRPHRQAPTLKLTQGKEVLAIRLCADLAHQRGSVIVTGYDADAKDVIDERVGPEAVEAETTGGLTGARLVSKVLGDSVTLRVREAALTSAEAGAWAKAEMLQRGRRFVTVQGMTRGTPDMIVGSRLTLSLVGRPFEGGGYYVTRVKHVFENVHGLRTHFEAERATLNGVA